MNSGPLILVLLDPPGQLLTGRSQELTAELHNVSGQQLVATCADRFAGLLLADGRNGLLAGGGGWRNLRSRRVRLAVDGRAVLPGAVEPRRFSRQGGAAFLPTGRYGLVVRLHVHLERADGSSVTVEVHSQQVPVTVVATRPG